MWLKVAAVMRAHPLPYTHLHNSLENYGLRSSVPEVTSEIVTPRKTLKLLKRSFIALSKQPLREIVHKQRQEYIIIFIHNVNSQHLIN